MQRFFIMRSIISDHSENRIFQKRIWVTSEIWSISWYLYKLSNFENLGSWDYYTVHYTVHQEEIYYHRKYSQKRRKVNDDLNFWTSAPKTDPDEPDQCEPRHALTPEILKTIFPYSYVCLVILSVCPLYPIFNLLSQSISQSSISIADLWMSWYFDVCCSFILVHRPIVQFYFSLVCLADKFVRSS